MGKEAPREQFEKPADWKSFSKALKQFAETCRDALNKDQYALLQRLSLLAEVEKDHKKASELLRQHREEIQSVVVEQILRKKVPPEAAKVLLEVFAENQVMAEVYFQFGNQYELGGTGQETTDCVRILRKSKTFRDLADKNPTRFFSEGSDLVLDEQLGHVVDTVDRKDFGRLRQYRPTKNKIYIFGLVRPPLHFNGKPNITHIQVATDLQQDQGKLAVIHASSDQGKVVIEEDIGSYLSAHHFERVYVVEIDLDAPYVESRSQREPIHEVRGYTKETYKRPSIYVLPVTLSRFSLIEPKGTEVAVDNDETRTLRIIADNRALEYLTILTAIREGKIGHKSNIMESMAFRTVVNPEKHSLGLHQVTKVVTPLFDRWIESVSEETAQALGPEVVGLWQKKQEGKSIEWADLVPFLNSYDITEARYTNVTISTICAYLLIRHLFEDQLLSAYETYGETFFGLEEQPEAVIALGAAYRSNMDVMVRGSQQYRIAEMAYKLDLIDENFRFTAVAKAMPEYETYRHELVAKKSDIDPDTFLVDGYRGVQIQHLAYMCYKSLHPNGELPFHDFEYAYGTSRKNMLSPRSNAVSAMRGDYINTFGFPPHLLMTEDELRGNSASALHTRSLTFANEGLWIAAHFRKLSEDNWDEIDTKWKNPGGEGNTLIDNFLEEESLRTNEISKVDAEQGKRFRSLIESLPGNPWYKKYPDLIMSACFVGGYFLKEAKHKNDGRWITETKAFIHDMFEENLPALEAKLPPGTVLDESDRAELAVATSIMSLDEIVRRITVDAVRPAFLLESINDKSGIRLNVYRESFYAQRDRFVLKSRALLEKKTPLTEHERQAAFTLRVFDAARSEAYARTLPMDFAYVATAMAALECGWGKTENEWGEPTLFAAANNIFSIKHDYRQYTDVDYQHQNSQAPFYIHHTKEYFDPSNPQEYTEHYEAFRRYGSVEDSVRDFFDLLERSYPMTMELGRELYDYEEPNPDNQETLFETLVSEKYATDPSYAAKAASVCKRVIQTLREYGQVI